MEEDFFWESRVWRRIPSGKAATYHDTITALTVENISMLLACSKYTPAWPRPRGNGSTATRGHTGVFMRILLQASGTRCLIDLQSEGPCSTRPMLPCLPHALCSLAYQSSDTPRVLESPFHINLHLSLHWNWVHEWYHLPYNWRALPS